jgi:hypothetical protein
MQGAACDREDREGGQEEEQSNNGFPPGQLARLQLVDY